MHYGCEEMRPMKLTNFHFLSVFAALSLAASPVAAQIVNGGFEAPVTSDGPPFVGFWEAFNGGPGSSAANSTLFPRTGLQSLNVSIVNTDNTFAGVFQDIPSITAGMGYTLSGWHLSNSSPLDMDVEVRIEWRNSAGNNEVGRTPNLLPIATSSYTPFSLTATAPAGADLARLVYAGQTFTGGAGNNGSVFVDDVSFTVVPEPSTFALLCLGIVPFGFMLRRRRI